MAGIDLKMEIKGLKELQKKLEGEALLGSPLKRLLGRAALLVERNAKINAPVDTGRLRASITPVVDDEVIPLWSKVGTNVEYASHVEYGKGKPRGVGQIPFLKPAFEKVKDKIDGLLSEAKNLIEGNWSK